ncbi:MAG: flavoprotein, partial [Glaciecola sp.]
MNQAQFTTPSAWDKRITLAITGASGTPYALRLLELLVKAEYQVYVLISSAAKVVLATEENLKVPSKPEA